MPGRRWHGGGTASSLAIRRFIEPCILLLLREQARHGYDLAQSLAEFGIQPIDPSMVYRVLRNMEGAGLIVSQWESGNSGPARRVYRLTALGNGYLADSVAQLWETDRIIHHFLDSYDRRVKKDESESR